MTTNSKQTVNTARQSYSSLIKSPPLRQCFYSFFFSQTSSSLFQLISSPNTYRENKYISTLDPLLKISALAMLLFSTCFWNFFPFLLCNSHLACHSFIIKGAKIPIFQLIPSSSHSSIPFILQGVSFCIMLFFTSYLLNPVQVEFHSLNSIKMASTGSVSY